MEKEVKIMLSSKIVKSSFVGVVAVLMLFAATSLVVAGDGPEPGPPTSDVPYVFVPPPFIGDMTLWLAPDPEYAGQDGLYISGDAYQVGQSGCMVSFATGGVLIAGAEQLMTGGFAGISCADLRPRDFGGNCSQTTSPGVTFAGCNFDPQQNGWYIQIMTAGNIVCADVNGQANAGSAKIIFMLTAPK